MIEVRVHHLLCIPRFYRGGYDDVFAVNMKNVCQEIRRNPELKVKVIVGSFDCLCMKCPHKGDVNCVQSKTIGKWVVNHDKKVAEYLDLKDGDVFSARDVFNLSMDKVNPDTIKDVCSGCVFLPNCVKVGINNSFRKDLNSRGAHPLF